jgi:hypothetical protein
MDPRDLRRISRQFYHRHRSVWRFIDENDPGFWPDLFDTMEEAHRWRFVPEGENRSRVTELPRTREDGTQTAENPSWLADVRRGGMGPGTP